MLSKLTQLFSPKARPAQPDCPPGLGTAEVSEPVERYFETYAEAAAACGAGYEDAELVRFIALRARGAAFDVTTLPTPSMLATFEALRRLDDGTEFVRVMDVGGAFGAHLKWAEHHVPRKYKWAVVETPAFVKAAESSDNLQFFSSMAEAAEWLGGIDFLLASGVLPYFAVPEQTLATMASLQPTLILFSRTVLSLGQPVFTVQKTRLFDNGAGPIPSGFTDRDIHLPYAYHPVSMLECALPGYLLEYRLFETPPYGLQNQMVREGGTFLFKRA